MARLKIYNSTTGQWEYVAYGIPGDDGREVELQKGATHIQWRYEGDTTWTDLVALADIQGPQGEQGEPGDDWIPVTVSSASGTVAKVGTTSGGGYVPSLGDNLIVTFSNGFQGVDSPTLNIDGSGAKPILIGDASALSVAVNIGSSIKLKLWYDGAAYQLDGSKVLLGEITESEITSGTSVQPAAITGRRAGFLKSLILRAAYPIGSVYINANDATNPATLFGFGTWVAWGVGKAIVGIDPTQTEFDTAEETGGEKTHTLTEAEMPSHTHSQNAHSHTPSSGGYRFGVFQPDTSTETVGGIAGTGWQMLQTTGSVTSNTNTANTTATNNDTGGGGAHNNLQPYQVGYVWKRTA